MGSIKDNYANIMNNISNIASKTGDSFTTPTVIGITKSRSLQEIKELIDCGISNIGESRLQEAKNKLDTIKDYNVKLHFIGRIQRRKIKDIVGLFDVIHSLDSTDMAQVINTVASMKNHKQKVLLQLNLAKEKQKGGVILDDLEKVIDDIKIMDSIILSGFMLIPPNVENNELNRPYFNMMSKIFNKYKSIYPSINILSMGMSNDYDVAIQEGATHLRIGTAFFI